MAPSRKAGRHRRLERSRRRNSSRRWRPPPSARRSRGWKRRGGARARDRGTANRRVRNQISTSAAQLCTDGVRSAAGRSARRRCGIATSLGLWASARHGSSSLEVDRGGDLVGARHAL
ncbi:hypothetical protein FHS96_000720 [Sphingomonas zeicaulis]